MKPSPTQLDVLAQLRKAGTKLVRWPGGFWTYDGCPSRTDLIDFGNEVPEWYTTLQTIRAMERRGWLVRTQVHPEEWRDERTVTIEGLKLVE